MDQEANSWRCRWKAVVLTANPPMMREKPSFFEILYITSLKWQLNCTPIWHETWRFCLLRFLIVKFHVGYACGDWPVCVFGQEHLEHGKFFTCYHFMKENQIVHNLFSLLLHWDTMIHPECFATFEKLKNTHLATADADLQSWIKLTMTRLALFHY